MKKYILITILVLISTPLYAEDDCLFDQEEQTNEYIKLQKKYPDSKYIKKEYKLVIPRNGYELILRRGGCEHFGIRIELNLPKTNDFKTENVFFKKIVELIKEFGEELISPEELKQIIINKKWTDFSDKKGMYYFIEYTELTSFEVYQRHSDTQTTLGVLLYM